VLRYWDKWLFLPRILCLGTEIKSYFWLGTCLGSGIKSYFCLGSCLGTGIKSYFCQDLVL
jgi:hypothetical protein